MLRLTRAQVREVDRRSIEEYHIPGIVLMENAARSAAAIAMAMSPAPQSAVILCGGGNNGGDGLAIARHLLNAGWLVDIILCSEKPYTGDALINFQILSAMGMKFGHSTDAESRVTVEAQDLVIDAVFGTGLQSTPRRSEQTLIEMINQSGLPVLAIDIPSGLDCDTGKPHGEACVKATRTVTFVAEKAGFANPQARQYTGEIIVGDIGCPKGLAQAIADSGNQREAE